MLSNEKLLLSLGWGQEEQGLLRWSSGQGMQWRAGYCQNGGTPMYRGHGAGTSGSFSPLLVSPIDRTPQGTRRQGMGNIVLGHRGGMMGGEWVWRMDLERGVKQNV